ncbi:MAG: hypothetical protein JO255_11310 [Alphaproteobacteria bacterium]|nr:hypothetical protein [Alphaproteobacteria bacterium]
MVRTHLWFLTISIIFVSMMAGLMPGEQKKQLVQGKMIVNWRENYSGAGESFTEETWMPTCYLLQRAASRMSDSEHDGVKVSCDEQVGGNSASAVRPPRSRSAAAQLQRRDDIGGLRERADCRSDQCDNLKNVTNIGLNAR